MEETKAPDLDEHIYDVIIVGAGFAGLSAALYFRDCGINNILVLEADDRIGGRVLTKYITIDDKQCQVDIGAAYSGPKQNRTLNMADRFGVKLYKAIDASTGYSILNYSGKIQIMDNIMGIIKNFWNFIDINYGIQQINKLVEQIPKMDDEMLRKYDSITFQNWAESIMSHNKFVQDFLCSTMELITCTNPSQISMLTSIEEFTAAGSVEAETASQAYKFHGGTYSIATKMMKEINKDGDKIRLNHIVTSLDHNDEKVSIIKCDNGKVFTCKYTMICTPPNRYKSIQFKPSLSWERISVTNQMIQGHIVRVYVFYKTAFWRDNGLSGFSMTCGDAYHNTDQYPIIGSNEDTKPDGTFPCIMGVIVSDKAIELTANYTKEERKDIILKQYAKTYNDERAITECVSYMEYIWHDNQFIGGGYAAVARMGTLTQAHYDKIKKPEGDKVYFACTELAEEWDSYIDGAIERGQREGNKIAKLLAKDNDEVRVIEFKENEPEATNLGDVDGDDAIPWIQRNFPNSRQIQNGILLSMVAIGVYLNFRKR